MYSYREIMSGKHRLLDIHVCSFDIQISWKIGMGINLLEIATGKKTYFIRLSLVASELVKNGLNVIERGQNFSTIWYIKLCIVNNQ